MTESKPRSSIIICGERRRRHDGRYYDVGPLHPRSDYKSHTITYQDGGTELRDVKAIASDELIEVSEPERRVTTEHVNHPKHYGGDTAYEAIRVMEAWHGPEAVRTFCILTAEKYLARAGKKASEPMLRDLEKAAWYTAKAVELQKKIEGGA